MLKISIYLLIGTLVLLGVALWHEPANYKVGDKVTIKDCTIWDESASKFNTNIPNMTSGYVIGKYTGVVKKVEVIRRRVILRPVYRYGVEFQYKNFIKTEWYVESELDKYAKITTQPTTRAYRVRIPIGN